jgi:hypothetical protein
VELLCLPVAFCHQLYYAVQKTGQVIKSIIVFCIFFYSGFASQLKAQQQIRNLSEKLETLGFENVRVLQNGKDVAISMEDNIYRWNVAGIRVALDSIASCTRDSTFLSIYFLKKDIPQLVVKVPALAWRNYTSGLVAASEISNVLQVVYPNGNNWKTLKQISPLNRSTNKIDFVLYPQFAFQNTLITQLYEVQLNLAPALEVSLWKGMQFTGQVIFPIVNELGYEGDFIRPGFVTLSQDFRLAHQWLGRVTTGKFNAKRYGADVVIDHPLQNNRWKIGLNAGLTGISIFYDGQWFTGDLNTITWFTKVGYYYPRFNLQFDLSYGRYLNKDYGFRADCTRHFGETTIGFYAMYTGGEPNGGFHFSIPLPPCKRTRKHTLRLVPANYYDLEYNAGTEFYYGRYYETRPNENRSERWNNPLFIKNEILKNIEK